MDNNTLHSSLSSSSSRASEDTEVIVESSSLSSSSSSLPFFHEPRVISVYDRKIAFTTDTIPPLYTLARSWVKNDPTAIFREQNYSTDDSLLYPSESQPSKLKRSLKDTDIPTDSSSSLVYPTVSTTKHGRYNNADSHRSQLSEQILAKPIIDRSTSLPIIDLQLPLPAPHSEGAQQRLVPQTTECDIDEIAPRTMITPPPVPSRSTRGNNQQTYGIPHETMEDRQRSAQLRDYHVQYFRQLKTWFKTGYRYRQLRFRDRLSQLGVIHPSVEKLYATALRAAVLAQSTSSGTIDATDNPQSSMQTNQSTTYPVSVTSPSNHGTNHQLSSTYPVISDSPRTTLAAIVNLAKNTELHPNLLNSPINVRRSSNIHHANVLLTPNPHQNNTDGSFNPLLSTPGIGSAQAARSLANFASIDSLNSNTTSRLLSSKIAATAGLQSPPPPRRIAGQFTSLSSSSSSNDKDSYFNVSAPWGRSLFLPPQEGSNDNTGTSVTNDTNGLHIKSSSSSSSSLLSSSHPIIHSPKESSHRTDDHPSNGNLSVPREPDENNRKANLSSSPVQLNQIADILTNFTRPSSD